MTHVDQTSVRNEVRGAKTIQRNYSAIGSDILFPHDIDSKSSNLAAVSNEMVKKKKTVRTGRVHKNSLRPENDTESLFKDLAAIATAKSRHQLHVPPTK